MFQKINLLICHSETFQRFYLPIQFICKPFWINGVIAINKLIFYHGTRIIVDDGTTHGKFIQVIVCKMINDLFHDIEVKRVIYMQR